MNASALTEPQRRLVEDYLRSLDEAGLDSGPAARQAAQRFCAQVGDLNSWAALSLDEQCALHVRVRRVVGWLLVTQRMRASAGYLVTGATFLGHIRARHHARLFAGFQSTGQSLGFIADRIKRQWAAVMRISALLGVPPGELTTAHLASGRCALVAECEQRARPGQAERLSMAIFQASTTLFHLGVTQEVLAQRGSTSESRRAAGWAAIAPGVATTIAAYLEQISVSLAPSTVHQIEGTLREFSTFLTADAPEVAGVKDVTRVHIEAYKKWLVERPSAKGERLRRQTVGKRLSILRTLCERLIAWGWDDAPASVPVLAGDAPLPEQRLPRFIDDGASARLLAAARADPDLFVRLCVEFLARTGLRKGEFLDLELDCVVKIGSAYWLRVPLGKLRNDRYIPLHPELKALLDAWLQRRPASLRSGFMFVERGRRISARRADEAIAGAASAAGIGHVTAHQLRHTLATQAINRGMSLRRWPRCWGTGPCR